MRPIPKHTSIWLFVLPVLLSSCSLFRPAQQKKAPVVIKQEPVAKKETNPVLPVTGVTLNDEPERKETTEDPYAIPDLNPELLNTLQFKYAILLDIPVEESLEHKVLGFIEHWYGTRYKMGGRDLNGLDCSSFAQYFIGAIYNVALPRTSREQFSYSLPIRREELKEGDLVFFYTGRKKVVSHVGVYLRNNRFAHASTSNGVIISSLDEPYYKARFIRAGRIPK